MFELLDPQEYWPIARQAATYFGVQLGEFLGCGNFGCVFSAPPNRVIKIGSQPSEQTLARRIFSQKISHPWFPAVTGVLKISENMYAILREEVPDARFEEIGRAHV